MEARETFTVNLANVSVAMVSDGQALGSIINDDLSGLSISDALVGSTGTEADACRNLAQYIAQTETRIAARELGQKRGIALIVKAENLRQQLRCR